jgi:L-alanine-DL-glutamate epimerase-like enolase superfamily enzyme
VDANGGWTAKEAIERLPALIGAGVELLEQPVAAADLLGLARVRDASRIPVLADEPALTAADIPRLAGMADGVNVKLAKTGGIRPALAMIQTARAHGLRVMLGCMVESSIGIAAAVQLSPLVDWVDLDGHLLLARDPARGLSLVDGRILPPGAPGIGVELVEPLFTSGAGAPTAPRIG